MKSQTLNSRRKPQDKKLPARKKKIHQKIGCIQTVKQAVINLNERKKRGRTAAPTSLDEASHTKSLEQEPSQRGNKTV